MRRSRREFLTHLVRSWRVPHASSIELTQLQVDLEWVRLYLGACS